jgi:PKD repeat protein
MAGTLMFTSAGTYTVTATVSDGALSNSKTFTWTVTNSNRAPTLTQPANRTSAEGSAVSVQLVASDPDGTALTYSATGLPAPLSVNASTGVISGTLPFTSAGTYNVTATASDGALSNSKTFSWTVTDVSAGPSITSLSPTSGAVGTSVTITGTNFGSTQGASSVRFNGTVGTPGTWSAGSLVVPVPTGATTGAVVVTVAGVVSNGVTFTVSTSTALPAPWVTQDVGGPAVAGSAAHTAGTFSVSGGGVDIWNGSDQFRFVYRTLDGNGEIIARVGSLQNADPWTKAAVMIREDLVGTAPNAAAVVTPGNGMIFQSRVTRGGISTSIKGFAGAAPQWIRLVRSGNTLSGYYSVNGTAWTLMGSSTVAMASRVYIGLAVTSHNPSVSASATFTNVTTTGGVSASLTSPARSPNPTIAQPEGAAHVAAGNAVVSASPVNRVTAWPILDSGTNDAPNLDVSPGVPLRRLRDLHRARAMRLV